MTASCCLRSLICGIEGITNFHGRLILNNGTSVRYFESTYCAILLDRFYFHIFSFSFNVIGLHLHLGMSDDVLSQRHYEFLQFIDY